MMETGQSETLNRKTADHRGTANHGRSQIRVHLQDVWFRFEERYALAGANLEGASGRPVILVGPNGGGKTTLLRVLAGLLRPDSGTITWQDGAGRPLDEETVSARRLFLPAEPSLYPDLTPLRNVTLWAKLWNLPEPEHRARSALVRLGIGPEEERPVQELSRGQQRRVDLARILALPADVLLLDEPDSGLDPEGRALLADLLTGYRGLCVLATHDLELASRLDGSIFEVAAGRIEPRAAGGAV